VQERGRQRQKDRDADHVLERRLERAGGERRVEASPLREASGDVGGMNALEEIGDTGLIPRSEQPPDQDGVKPWVTLSALAGS